MKGGHGLTWAELYELCSSLTPASIQPFGTQNADRPPDLLESFFFFASPEKIRFHLFSYMFYWLWHLRTNESTAPVRALCDNELVQTPDAGLPGGMRSVGVKETEHCPHGAQHGGDGPNAFLEGVNLL